MPDFTPETWRPVPGFPNYEASDQGRVRALPRVTADGRHKKAIVLKQHRGSYEYMVVTLLVNGRKRPYRVHRLVADAFLGPRPDWADTRHGPGGRQDNRLVNLCYGTRAENEEDKKRDGTFRHGGGKLGTANQNARLTEEAVRDIRARYATGNVKQTELAQAYSVTQTTIYNIVRNNTWKHLL